MKNDVKQKKQIIQQKIKDQRKKLLIQENSNSIQTDKSAQEEFSSQHTNTNQTSIQETIKSGLDSKFKLLKIDNSLKHAILFLNASKEKRFTIGGDYQILVLGGEQKINCTNLKADDCIKLVVRPLYPKAFVDLSKEGDNNANSESSEDYGDESDSAEEQNHKSQKDQSLYNLDQFCKMNNVSHYDLIKDCYTNGMYTHILFLSVLPCDLTSPNIYLKNYYTNKQMSWRYEMILDNKLYIKPCQISSQQNQDDTQNFDHNWDIKLECDESYKFIETKRLTNSFQEIKNVIEKIASSPNRYSPQKNFRTVLVCGEKNMGKTTLCQFICSTLKQGAGVNDHVFFLETDLGQPIFTLPAFITLVEITELLQVNCPSAALMKNTVASKYFGDFSPEANFVKYLQSIIEVMNKFVNLMKESKTKNNILVINTHGYVRSFGTMILNDQIKTTSPDLIVNINKGKICMEDSEEGTEEESTNEENDSQNNFSSINNLLDNSSNLTQINEMNLQSGQKTDNSSNNKKWNMIEINSFAKKPFSVNTQVKQMERKNFLRNQFSDEVYSINLNELNFGVLTENFDKVFRDSHINEKEALTVALSFINSICWVCLDGDAVSCGQTTLVHILDFDLREKLVYFRITITGNLNLLIKDSPSSKKRTLWKSTIIDYPLGEEWKENTEKFEIADFLNNSQGKRPFWIYPINGVGSKGVRNKASDRKNQS